MKALEITKMKIKDAARSMKNTAIVFIIPIIFMSIFGIVFGAGSQKLTMNIATVESTNQQFNTILEIISGIDEDETDLTITLLEPSNLEDARESLIQGESTIILEWDEQAQNVIVRTKPQDQLSQVYVAIIRQVVDGYFEVEASRVVEQPIEIDTELESYTPYQILVPGLLIYGIMILMPLGAGDFASITEKKQIFRYFTSRSKSRDILGGYLIYLTLMAIIQFALMLYIATMFGFRGAGSPILPFLLIGLPMILFTVGVALLIGSVSEKNETASNLGTIVSLILAFLSGTFIVGIESLLSVNIGNITLRLSDLLPTYHANEAMKGMLLYGQSVEDVLGRTIFILVSSLVIFMLGVFLFRKSKLTRLG